MNPSLSSTWLPAAEPAPMPPDSLARDLAALVEDIQRTKEWFNAQMDAQLAGLHHLRAALNIDPSACGDSIATLFEPPQPVEEEEPIAVLPLPPMPVAHPAVILPPSKITSLDPDLEQATLRELNEALSSAFAEISARGGMLV